jgi:hypothetical protein
VIKTGITDASEDELKALKAMKRSKSITLAAARTWVLSEAETIWDPKIRFPNLKTSLKIEDGIQRHRILSITPKKYLPMGIHT